MSTFELTGANDFAFVDGNLVLVSNLAQEVAIDLKTCLQMFLGEWFLDTRLGMPYFQAILGVKQPQLPALKKIFDSAIRQREGVADVPLLEVTFDSAARTLRVDLRVLTSDGFIITGGTHAPFIVELS